MTFLQRLERPNYSTNRRLRVRGVLPGGYPMAMAVFLASKRGQNIAGQTKSVDGGYVMHW